MTDELKSFMIAFVVGGLIAWLYATLHTRRSRIRNPVMELLFSASMYVVLGIAAYIGVGGKGINRWEWISFAFYAALASVIRFIYLKRRGQESNPSSVEDPQRSHSKAS